MGTQEGEKTLSRQELGRAFPWDGIHRAMGSPRENEESSCHLRSTCSVAGTMLGTPLTLGHPVGNPSCL